MNDHVVEVVNVVEVNVKAILVFLVDESIKMENQVMVAMAAIIKEVEDVMHVVHLSKIENVNQILVDVAEILVLEIEVMENELYSAKAKVLVCEIDDHIVLLVSIV